MSYLRKGKVVSSVFLAKNVPKQKRFAKIIFLLAYLCQIYHRLRKMDNCQMDTMAKFLRGIMKQKSSNYGTIKTHSNFSAQWSGKESPRVDGRAHAALGNIRHALVHRFPRSTRDCSRIPTLFYGYQMAVAQQCWLCHPLVRRLLRWHTRACPPLPTTALRILPRPHP